MSGSKDRGVQFWDPQTGMAQMMLQGHKNSGMLSPHYKINSDVGMHLLTSDFSTVISVAPSPVGNLFATGSGDMKARIWRLALFDDIRPITPFASRITSLLLFKPAPVLEPTPLFNQIS